MSSMVEICNMSLGQIGVTEVIADIEEDSVAARQCLVYFAQSRDWLLQKFDWWFARRSVALAEITNDKSDMWEFCYAVDHPDLLTVRFVDVAEYRPGDVDPAAYLLEAGKVYSNVQDAWLHYTMRVDDPELLRPHFVEALTWRLASALAFPITKDHQIRKDAVQLAEQARMTAEAVDANQENQCADALPALIRARAG